MAPPGWEHAPSLSQPITDVLLLQSKLQPAHHFLSILKYHHLASGATTLDQAQSQSSSGCHNTFPPPAGFKQQKLIVSQFWRPEASVLRTVLSLKAFGKNASLPLPAPGGPGNP